MKSTITYTVLIAFACTLFLSCNQEKATEAVSNKKEAVKDSIIEQVINNNTYEIKDEAEAIEGLEKYKDYIELVQNSLDPNDFPNRKEKLNYGSESYSEELIAILINVRDQKQSKITNDSNEERLFLMNAILPKRDEDRVIIGEEFVTEIIYVLQSTPRDKDHKLQPTLATYTYFDFTRPCPTGCPNNIPSIVYLE